MKRCATTLFSLLLIATFASSSFAQTDVTVREINAIDADSIAALNAGGAALTVNEIGSLTTAALNQEVVRFTGVVLSDPRNSGLSTPNSGLPSRVHVFVRDTTAATQGNDGMTVQVVDGAWQTNGTTDLLVGDVIEVVGTVAPFFTTMQVSPTSIELKGAYTDFGLPASILDPVVVTIADINRNVGAGLVQGNWDNFAALRGQFVRVEGASLVQRDISTTRPDWLLSDDAGVSTLNVYDTSLRYRNDRGDYDGSIFNPLDDDFVPPPPGSAVNIQGFLTFNNDDPFSTGLPAGSMYKINPMADSDLEITETTPIISNIATSQSIPTDAFDVTATIVADPSRSITGATLSFYTSSSSDTTDVAGTGVDGNYTFPIPAQTDGDFVTFYITAEDNQSGVSVSPDQSVRFLSSGLTTIAHIQETADGGPGNSPFAGLDDVAMNLTVTVQHEPFAWRPSSSTPIWNISVQDDVSMAAWSGIILAADSVTAASIAVGDQINITQASIVETFNVTELRDAVFTVVGSGAPITDKSVTTDVVADPAIAEAHEGMYLAFSDVIISSPGASGSPWFGEWTFYSSTASPDDTLRADDDADAIGSSFGSTTFTPNNQVDLIRGVMWYSFGDYKIVPTSLSDIGTITAVEDEDLPEGFTLEQNYPNPFNPSTTIRFAVDQTGPVQLEVFDVLGRRVATLVNRDLPVGAHVVSFDGAQVASGLYLYRLSSGTQVVTKTMTLLK